MIFDPDRVIPISAHTFDADWSGEDPTDVVLSKPLTMEQIKKISDDDQKSYDEWNKKYDDQMAALEKERKEADKIEDEDEKWKKKVDILDRELDLFEKYA